MPDSIRKFMYIKYSGGNAKLRIFSLIPKQQRIQPNFIAGRIRIYTYETVNTT